MKKFSPLALIKKYRLFILAAAVLSGLGAMFLFTWMQSYTATTVIEYTNDTAEQGLAPDGTEIDTSEIYSADVMKEVFTRMDLDYDDYNMDEFRSKVEIVPLQTSEEEAVQEAMNEEGEEVEEEPVRYQVSITLSRNDASDPGTFSRQLLDNMLDVFLEKYGETHVNGTSFVNQISEINTADHDYLEIIELIETSVSTTVESLAGYVENNVAFTSSANGYSFNDIYRDLGLFQSNEIPDIYAYILNNRITKDPDILTSKYKNRIEEYGINNSSYEEQIDDILEIIDAYVKMMRESGNTDITYEYILDQVYDDYYYEQQAAAQAGAQSESEDGSAQELPDWQAPDETVQYDVLLENYVSNRSACEYALIDSAYCQYILDLYGDAGSASAEEEQQNVSRMLDELVGELNVVYGRLDEISSEFNEYAGAMNVTLNSDIIVKPNIQILLYSMLVVVVFAMAAVAAVLVAGRTGDILDYYMYTDRKLLLPNRTACDRYLNRNEKAMLDNDFVCIALLFTGLSEKNRQFGRERCDAMLVRFAGFLKQIFPSSGGNMTAVNGFGQFVVFLDKVTEEQAQAYLEYLADEAEEYNKSEKCRMEYRSGIAHAKTEHIFRLRDLMVRAIHKAGGSQKKDMPPEAEAVREPVQAPVQESVQEPVREPARESVQQSVQEPVRESGGGDRTDERLTELLRRLEEMRRG